MPGTFSLIFLRTVQSFSSGRSTVGQKRKRNTPIYFITNYRTEIKLIPIIMDYYLLQFNDLNFFLGVRLTWPHYYEKINNKA